MPWQMREATPQENAAIRDMKEEVGAVKDDIKKAQDRLSEKEQELYRLRVRIADARWDDGWEIE